jgi:hypothetical protein
VPTRWKILLALIPATAVVAFLVAGPHNDPEPHYKGKKLSTWIGMYLGPSERVLAPQEQRDRVDQAVRSIGTNAIPYLLDWYAYDKFPRMDKADSIYTNLPRTIRTNASVIRLLYSDPKERRSVCAAMALAAMDQQALNSDRTFIRFISNTNTFSEWYRARKLVDVIDDLPASHATAASTTNGPPK